MIFTFLTGVAVLRFLLHLSHRNIEDSPVYFIYFQDVTDSQLNHLNFLCNTSNSKTTVFFKSYDNCSLLENDILLEQEVNIPSKPFISKHIQSNTTSAQVLQKP